MRFTTLSLRWQMFLSYAFVVLITLAVVALALIFITGSRPAPNQVVYQRLAALVQGLNVREVLSNFGALEASQPGNRARTVLDEFARSRGVRVLWLYTFNGAELVLYDSDERFASRDEILLQNELFISTQLQQLITPRSRQIYGTFRDPDGSEWVFGGLARSTQVGMMGRESDLSSALLLAEPRPTISLQALLDEFGAALLPPFLQAAVVGFVVAGLLAALITRGILRPVQALARAAGSLARGDYEHKVPESGPGELRALAAGFNQMSDEVRRAQQAQRDFVANVSHDLKTPLTSIQGYSQAIIDGAAKDPTQAARIIHDEAARLNRMVVQLTDLVRMQAGRLSLHLEALDMGEISRAIGERLQVVARKKGVELLIDAPSMPRIAGDGDRLSQVLTNLLSNAIHFTPRGGRVQLRTSLHNGGVQVVVQDSGVGIPPEDLPRIFERFYQVDKARGPRRDGTGLGLAIVQEIVHAHRGTISAFSAGEGLGATFTVWLPLPDATAVNRVRSAARPVEET